MFEFEISTFCFILFWFNGIDRIYLHLVILCIICSYEIFCVRGVVLLTESNYLLIQSFSILHNSFCEIQHRHFIVLVAPPMNIGVSFYR